MSQPFKTWLRGTSWWPISMAELTANMLSSVLVTFDLYVVDAFTAVVISNLWIMWRKHVILHDPPVFVCLTLCDIRWYILCLGQWKHTWSEGSV